MAKEGLTEVFDGFVYFLLAPDLKMLKIGFTKSPAERYKKLNQYVPFPVEYLRLVKASYNHEQMLFQILGDFKVKNEWFRAVPILLEFIRSLPPGQKLTYERIAKFACKLKSL